MKKKVIVIGGVAAGPKAASRIKRLSPDTEVTVIEKNEFISYAGCGLPYYISGVVKNQADLMNTPTGTVRDTNFFKNVKDVKMLNRTEAISIDRAKKEVRVLSSNDNKEDVLSYDDLIFATGATPIKPGIEGIELKNIFMLHSIEDSQNIKKLVEDKAIKNAVIIGAGLIGLEMAEAFKALGLNVTILEKLPRILSFLDEEISMLVLNHLKSKGIEVVLNAEVIKFLGSEFVKDVETKSGNFSCDIAIAALGVRPNVKLAKQAGINIGVTGAIAVNDKMQTNDPNIYAIGDCAETINLITKRSVYVPLGSTANKQGRVAANDICGVKDSFPGILQTSICKVFDFGVAKTGLSEAEAINAGFDVVTVLSPSPDRPHFYPGAKPIFIKLIVDKKTRVLLGSQIIGPGDIDKRIDIAATAITASMTVDTIANLDLAYAPPYSPAMDNIITAVNIARNKLDNGFQSITLKQVKEKIDAKEDFVFLDVRSKDEYDAIHLENTKLIPLGKLRQEFGQIQKDKEIVVFCKISLRGYEAALILKSNGFKNVKVMDGGIVMWPYSFAK